MACKGEEGRRDSARLANWQTDPLRLCLPICKARKQKHWCGDAEGIRCESQDRLPLSKLLLLNPHPTPKPAQGTGPSGWGQSQKPPTSLSIQGYLPSRKGKAVLEGPSPRDLAAVAGGKDVLSPA